MSRSSKVRITESILEKIVSFVLDGCFSLPAKSALSHKLQIAHSLPRKEYVTQLIFKKVRFCSFSLFAGTCLIICASTADIQKSIKHETLH